MYKKSNACVYVCFKVRQVENVTSICWSSQLLIQTCYFTRFEMGSYESEFKNLLREFLCVGTVENHCCIPSNYCFWILIFLKTKTIELMEAIYFFLATWENPFLFQHSTIVSSLSLFSIFEVFYYFVLGIVTNSSSFMYILKDKRFLDTSPFWCVVSVSI